MVWKCCLTIWDCFDVMYFMADCMAVVILQDICPPKDVEITYNEKVVKVDVS